MNFHGIMKIFYEKMAEPATFDLSTLGFVRNPTSQSELENARDWQLEGGSEEEKARILLAYQRLAEKLFPKG